jgi:hypothetical protein
MRQTIEKLDTFLLYSLELASSLSVILLAFGLIASMANALTEGSILTENEVMRQIWALEPMRRHRRQCSRHYHAQFPLLVVVRMGESNVVHLALSPFAIYRSHCVKQRGNPANLKHQFGSGVFACVRVSRDTYLDTLNCGSVNHCSPCTEACWTAKQWQYPFRRTTWTGNQNPHTTNNAYSWTAWTRRKARHVHPKSQHPSARILIV